jgi:septum formation protein
MTPPATPRLVLASASSTRALLLERAGVPFSAEPAAVDEAEVKAAFKAEGADAASCAEALAEAKARSVARRRPGALVIGADQILVCGGTWYDKPADLDQARAQLVALRGKTHELATACCVLRDGVVLWHVIDRPRLTMRGFSDAFLDQYLAGLGDLALGTVGAYQLEGPGVQLFAGISGDFFSILGLPLLPLLDFLRGHGVLAQ